MLVGLKDILKIAEADKTAVGMFNGTGFDSIRAVIGAAEELNRPVIIAHAEVHNVFNDISLVGPAMLAAARAAILRGSSITILPGGRTPGASNASGTTVLLPAPGSAVTTSGRQARAASAICGRTASMGSPERIMRGA